MRSSAVILALGMLCAAGPAYAGSGASGPVTATVADATWTSYDCQTTTATITVTTGQFTPWLATIQASPNGRSRLDAALFADIGSNVVTQPLLICPLDSTGPWTAQVQARFLTQTYEFPVAFTVSKVASTTTVTKARWRNKVLRVSGSVTTANGMAGRASIEILRLYKGAWRSMGHTTANSSGVYRFLAPRRAEQVRAVYLGDSVTLGSQAQLAVEIVPLKK